MKNSHETRVMYFHNREVCHVTELICGCLVIRSPRQLGGERLLWSVGTCPLCCVDAAKAIAYELTAAGRQFQLWEELQGEFNEEDYDNEEERRGPVST